MSAVGLALIATACHLATAIVAVATGRRSGARAVVYGTSFAVCTLLLTLALVRLAGAPPASLLSLPLGLPWIGAHFRLDALSGFFLLVVNLGGAAASLYGFGHGRHEPVPHRVLPFFPAFLAGMTLVILADDAFTFLLSWEFMSLASWALVMAHHREASNRRAGHIYIVMASFGTLALLLAFGILAGPQGAYAFDAMRLAGPSDTVATVVLVLVLLGAGSKAGLVPLHVWLPLAHPAAPSHVSALMSGVMTKVAVYGFIRVIFDLLGEPNWWSSALVLLLGGATAVMGILHALMESDLKRLLAYSTIENIGVIFVSLGLALAFQANEIGWAAGLALTAALFHVLNHSIFKSLLFFGAGAVHTATGERNMERLGGLIHHMPVTSIAFLTGCMALSALPPFNGFISEWLTFQAVLQSPVLPQWELKVLIPAIGGLLALSAALAAACFVKAFGVSFLGRPRSPALSNVGEVERISLAAMVILAFLCLLIGVLPALVIDALSPVSMTLLDAQMPSQMAHRWLTVVPVAESRSSYNGLLVLLFIVTSAALAVFLVRRIGSVAVRRGPAWGCGFAGSVPEAQYTGVSFAQPLRRVFGTYAFRARERIDMPRPGATEPARLQVEMHDLVWEFIYQPLADFVGRVTERLNHLQFLTIRRYLGLVFVYLVILLIALAAWP